MYYFIDKIRSMRFDDILDFFQRLPNEKYFSSQDILSLAVDIKITDADLNALETMYKSTMYTKQ